MDSLIYYLDSYSRGCRIPNTIFGVFQKSAISPYSLQRKLKTAHLNKGAIAPEVESNFRRTSYSISCTDYP